MPAAELRDRLRHGLTDHRLYAAERAPSGRKARLKEAGRNAAIGLGATSFLGAPIQFVYRGYKIPLDLAEMTGGADESWEAIALAHMNYYQRWTPIRPDDSVLEIGCGVGRDAIHLADVLSPRGRYVGVDISRPSIAWCNRNIAKRHPNFEFVALDVRSPMYNPHGSRSNTDVRFPLPDASFDRVVLHSVFTHMFMSDVSHYLTEIERVLRVDGQVLASFFVVDDESVASADVQDGPQTFRHEADTWCRINDSEHPEAAVGFTPEAIEKMTGAAALSVKDCHRGFWSGLHPDAPNGQDILVLEHA